MKITLSNHLKLRIITLFVFFLFGSFAYTQFSSFASNVTAESPQRNKQRRITTQQKKPAPKPTPAPKYSKFSHSVPKHQMACDACHKFPTANWKTIRKETDAFPDVTDYPKHESCLNCHRQQFFRGARPVICTICHTNPSPRDSSRHLFPNPYEIFVTSKKAQTKDSDFRVSFPHATHQDLFGYNERKTDDNSKARFVNASFKHQQNNESSCATCHQIYQPQGDGNDEYVTKPPKDLGDSFWLKKGTFKTVPTNHANCFTCHAQEGDIKPLSSDCATCHKLDIKPPQTDFSQKLVEKMSVTDKLITDKWARRESSATFRHEWFSHTELACSTCHNTATMNTADSKTMEVPVLSCGGGGSGCHVTPTTDDGGVLNFEIDQRKTNPSFMCAKCHINYSNAPIPTSHTNAITELNKKK